MITRQSTSRWFLVVLAILVLPVFQLPLLLSESIDGAPMVRLLVWLYPAYLGFSAYLAYICYPQRRVTAWILAFVMLLSNFAIYALVRMPLSL